MKKFGVVLLVVLALIVGVAIGQNNQVAVRNSTAGPLAAAVIETPASTANATYTAEAVRTVAPMPTTKATPTARPTPTASPTPTPDPTYAPLSSSDSGEDVLALQERLADLGYAIGKADGDYGAKTVSAVKMLQVLAGLKVTGVADDQTQQVIWGYDAPTPQPKPTPTVKPTKKPTPEPEPVDNGEDYIANKNTKKFHYPWCSSVDQMKESNKWYFTGSRETLIKKGYVPCKRCDP
jgi:peptidoglycan hydrolase-like protein with peptidoglycan-binding domain